MASFLAKRIVHTLLVVLVMSFAVFSMTAVLPGDPTITILGESATQEQRLELRREMRLDEPIHVRYGLWLKDALSGDLGRSIRTSEPIAQMLVARIPVTFELAALSILFGLILGIPLGVAAARWRATRIDLAVSAVAVSGMAIPYFWMGALMMMLFSVHLRWLPPSGYFPFLDDPVRNLQLMIMPTVTIGTSMAAVIMRQTRTSMLEVLSQDYVRTARAKGLPERVVVLKHALRNALNPIVTITGLQFGVLLGGAVVTENIFSLPGIGEMLVNGIFNRDYPAIQGAILVILVGVAIVNMLTDMTYTLIDRRIRQ